MSERDWVLFLHDISECSNKIMRYSKGLGREEFLADSKTFDAVVRNLAIIGEAAKKIPAEFRRSHPEIEWKKVTGLRDIVVHDYFGIDDDIIWDVVSSKIPQLQLAIALILKDEPLGASF